MKTSTTDTVVIEIADERQDADALIAWVERQPADIVTSWVERQSDGA